MLNCKFPRKLSPEELDARCHVTGSPAACVLADGPQGHARWNGTSEKALKPAVQRIGAGANLATFRGPAPHPFCIQTTQSAYRAAMYSSPLQRWQHRRRAEPHHCLR
jgi:hypothetical protein